MNTKSNLTGRVLVLLSLLFLFITGFAQRQTTKYIGTNGKLTTVKNAIYMQKINKKIHKGYKVQTYQLNDTKWEKIYSEHYKKLNDSTWQVNGNGKNIPHKSIRTFSKLDNNKLKFNDKVEGQVIRKGYAMSLVPLLLDGKVTEYYLGGIKKSVSVYNNNELVSNENWNEEGNKYIDNIFYSTDTYPTYSGGNEALHAHILECYKKSNLDISSVSGTLKVGFVVMENGTIDGIKILNGLGPKINETACNAFKTLQGKWTPAKLNNQTVRYFQVFPINFIYKENRFDYAEIRDAVLHYQPY